MGDTELGIDVAGMRRRNEAHRQKRFLVLVEGKRHWMTFTEAYHAINSSFISVMPGDVVFDLDGVERQITRQELDDIQWCADEWSALK